MNKFEKVKLLNRIAKGDLQALKDINPPFGVFCIDITDYNPIWVDDKYLCETYIREGNELIDNDERTQQILNDATIKKYNNAELLEMAKTRYVIAMPPDLLYGDVKATVDMFKRHNEFVKERKEAEKAKQSNNN